MVELFVCEMKKLFLLSPLTLVLTKLFNPKSFVLKVKILLAWTRLNA